MPKTSITFCDLVRHGGKSARAGGLFAAAQKQMAAQLDAQIGGRNGQQRKIPQLTPSESCTLAQEGALFCADTAEWCRQQKAIRRRENRKGWA